MNFVKERLGQLDREIAALSTEHEAAWKVYRSTKDPEGKEHCKKLDEEEDGLLEEGRAVLAKLPGFGESLPAAWRQVHRALSMEDGWWSSVS
jgi:hypothetical protein